MTYSIVARDPVTGALGVAVQTCMFAVGTVVPWARAGVGAVATQAFGEPAYGPRCLDALESGLSAVDALDAARATDPAPTLRQVAVLSADGSVGAFTGDDCIDFAGHQVGDEFAVQANMMASPEVWPAMADAFTTSEEPFSRRLLAALDAAQASGGDARGMMSAALLVVDAERRDVWMKPLVDLRVDQADDPLRELRRLVDASDAFNCFYRASAALWLGSDANIALREANDALALMPDEQNMRFVRARALLALGDFASARAEVRSLLSSRPTWETIVRSFAAKGRLGSLEPGAIETLLH
jgi:uncharacterized Ntn-hydrolase superfamily protein